MESQWVVACPKLIVTSWTSAIRNAARAIASLHDTQRASRTAGGNPPTLEAFRFGRYFWKMIYKTREFACETKQGTFPTVASVCDHRWLDATGGRTKTCLRNLPVASTITDRCY
jgi:hypothetical protein